jgi:hypothetical protein
VVLAAERLGRHPPTLPTLTWQVWRKTKCQTDLGLEITVHATLGES